MGNTVRRTTAETQNQRIPLAIGLQHGRDESRVAPSGRSTHVPNPNSHLTTTAQRTMVRQTSTPWNHSTSCPPQVRRLPGQTPHHSTQALSIRQDGRIRRSANGSLSRRVPRTHFGTRPGQQRYTSEPDLGSDRDSKNPDRCGQCECHRRCDQQRRKRPCSPRRLRENHCSLCPYPSNSHEDTPMADTMARHRELPSQKSYHETAPEDDAEEI